MKISQASYQNLLKEVKNSIQSAQRKAGRYVNQTMIELYWSIGKIITEKQDKEGWGKSVVEHLSKDLKKNFPNQKGFSTQNFWYSKTLIKIYLFIL